MFRKLLVAAVSLATVAGLSGTTAADTQQSLWSIQDGRSDAKRAIDQEFTTLSTRRRGYLTVRAHGYEFVRGSINFASVYFDTRRANTGPEYRLGWFLPHDGDGVSGFALHKTDSWTKLGRKVLCAKARFDVNYRADVVTLSVPRRCIGNPNKVRWNTETWKITEYGKNYFTGYLDATPRRRAFVPNYWVG